jgi:hypothetical protein
MAKKKKPRDSQNVAAISSSGSRMHLGIDSAENGYVIRVSGESNGKYNQKTLVATSPRQAFRVAAAHLPGMAKKAHTKKSRAKTFVSKKS